MSSPDAVLAWLTDPARADEARTREPDALDAWWRLHGGAGAELALPVDRAIVRGFRADRIGYAFAAGYQAALRSLVPDLPEHRVVSLCITEEGGGHPRAIATRLEPDAAAGTGWRLSGRKQWATLAGEATELLVAARIGEHEDGRPSLVLVRVAGGADGLTLTPMPATPFAPEIRHAVVEMDAVAVAADARLPGDGYARYVKPFRTIEDIHVHAALIAHLWRLALALDWPRTLTSELLAATVTLRGLAQGDPSSAALHIALGGAIEHGRALVERAATQLASAPSPLRERFERDRGIAGVAGGARAKRLERAFATTLRRDAS